MRFASNNPAAYRLMYGRDALDRAQYEDLDNAAQSAFDELVQTIARGQKEGLLRDGPAQDLAYVVWGLLHGVSSLLVDDQIEKPASVDALAQTALRSLLDGLAKR